MFTSPHLIDFTERIQVDGTQIPKNKAAEIGERLLGLKLDVEPSMFDYCFAMALLYFKEQRCQLVILETGLGGRLDSTNAIEAPLVSILTKVGYDHTEILGNSLEEIASEKAGILKKGTRAVLESQYHVKGLTFLFAKSYRRRLSHKTANFLIQMKSRTRRSCWENSKKKMPLPPY